MATIKLKFRPSSVLGAEGTLYYQITHKRCSRRLCTSYHIYPQEWDARTSTLLIPSGGERRNRLQSYMSSIRWEMRQYKRVLLDMELAGRDFSADLLCEAVRNVAPYKTVFAILEEQAACKEAMKRRGTAKNYRNACRRFQEFRNGEDMIFDELSPNLMEQYEAWLINRGLKQNTIRFYLRTLHTLFRKAVGEGMDCPRNLFAGIKISCVRTAKRAISEKEIRAIERLPLPEGSSIAFARDIFMFSFYMRGMSFVDMAWLKKSSLRNGMLEYCRRKTNQHLAIGWEKEPQAIVERYAHLTSGTPFLLPIIQKTDGTEYRQYQRKLENINRSLKRIGEMAGLKIPLTTYVARHSWASIARNMNISIAVISEGMGHSSYKTTQIYLDSIDTSKIDEANRRIIRKINAGG